MRTITVGVLLAIFFAIGLSRTLSHYLMGTGSLRQLATISPLAVVFSSEFFFQKNKLEVSYNGGTKTWIVSASPDWPFRLKFALATLPLRKCLDRPARFEEKICSDVVLRAICDDKPGLREGWIPGPPQSAKLFDPKGTPLWQITCP